MGVQTVIERKTRLVDGTVSEYTCAALELVPGERAILRYEIDREWKVGDLTIGPGAFTIGHYWADRPYNVYHWFDPDGRTLAYYVNIADQTEIAPGLVRYRDLVVDVILKPSGEAQVLDEEELPTDVPPAVRRSIAHAMEVVITGGRRLVAEIARESGRFVS